MRKPYLKLRRRIEDAGLDWKSLSSQTGVPYSTLKDHANTPETAGTWRWKEIILICKVVGIPQEQIGEYFFPCVEKGEST